MKKRSVSKAGVGKPSPEPGSGKVSAKFRTRLRRNANLNMACNISISNYMIDTYGSWGGVEKAYRVISRTRVTTGRRSGSF